MTCTSLAKVGNFSTFIANKASGDLTELSSFFDASLRRAIEIPWDAGERLDIAHRPLECQLENHSVAFAVNHDGFGVEAELLRQPTA
ncbi:MAG TPA: hypothetical protein VMS56_14250 [Thermoanaerobaculia bacterium]|nr:hypothetical protein [Thermoanaerobaculia bacterium]